MRASHVAMDPSIKANNVMMVMTSMEMDALHTVKSSRSLTAKRNHSLVFALQWNS